MKKIAILTCLRAALVIASFLIMNNNFAQTKSSLMASNIMKPKAQYNPVLQQIEKKQKRVRIGFGLETYVSGNAHGAFYSARINASKGKSVYSLGPCLHKRSLELTGVKLGYSYLLSGLNSRYDKEELEEMKHEPREILELRLLIYAQYLHKTRLSYAASRVETITSSKANVNYNDVRLNTIEAAVCAELDINIKWIKIRTYMGATAFYHTNQMEGMYRPKFSPALIFGTGFIIPSI